MSVENLKEYARRCAAEPELRARAKALGMGDAEGHMREAAALGLDWTVDDMIAFRKEVLDDGSLGELNEEDLEQIAGGAVTATAAVVGVVAAAVAGGVAGAAVGGVAVGAAVGGGVVAAGQGGW